MTDRCSPITSHQSPSLRQKLSALALVLALSLAGTHPARAALFGDWIADNYTNGASTWRDSSTTVVANQHNATAVGTLTVTPNAFGTHAGINFLGGNGPSSATNLLNYFTVANASPLVGATSLTLVAVMRPSATVANASGANFYNNAGLIGNEQSGTVNDWSLGFGGSQAVAGIGGVNNDKTTTSSSLTLGQSYVEIATWDTTSGSLKLYINGVLVSSIAASTAARDANASGTFALGADTALNNGDLHIFAGQIAELQIYNDIENVSTLNGTLAAKYGVVPEPSTWFGGAACAGVGLAALRRRRRTVAA